MIVEYLSNLGIEIDDVEEILNIYDSSIIKSLEISNIEKIIGYLKENNFSIDIIQDLIKEDLEIFTYQVEDIMINFNILKRKYQKNYIDKIIDNPEILYKGELC
jgi:hypothetical protein